MRWAGVAPARNRSSRRRPSPRRPRRRVVGAGRRRRRTARRGRWRRTARRPPKRPEADDRERAPAGRAAPSAASTQASASAVRSRPDRGDVGLAEHVAGGDAAAGGGPRQRLQRPLPLVEVRPPRQRAARPTSTSALAVEGLQPARRRPRRGIRSGLAPEDVAEQRGWCRAGRTAAGPTRATVAEGVGQRGRPLRSPAASLRRPSRPRSGSGDVRQPVSSSGRSCCISRDDRVSPRVSSRTAARVRSASVKPNAASAPAAASGDRPRRRPANASSSGRK